MLAAGTRQLDLHQFVRLQGDIQLGRHGLGHAALADADDGLAVMSAGPKKEPLSAGEHGGVSVDDETQASLGEALASIKRELAAIVVFGALYAWGVIHWFDGLEEAVLLAGYGVGAAVWIRVRAGGVLLALRHRVRKGHGSQQE